MPTFGDDENENKVVRLTQRGNGGLPPLIPADLSAWEGKDPPQRDWAVQDVLPACNVGLLSGEGAIGKSILMLQLCCAHVLARDWIGFMPAPGPAIYLGAEDDEDELHRRLHAITRFYDVNYSQLKGLRIFSLAGKDAVLGAALNRFSGLIQPTPLYAALLAEVERTRPKLIVLDTAADVFAGNENDRAQVRQFIGLLRALAIAGASAVLLASHPSVQGLNTNTGLSGSTAWHNSVRSRLFLKSAVNGNDGEETAAAHDQLRILEMKKSNYGPITQRKTLIWQDGVFTLAKGESTVDRTVAEHVVEQKFLTILGRYQRDGRNVSEHGGARYAPTCFAREPEAAGSTPEDFKRAMVRLFAQEKIRVDEYGKPSNRHARIVLAGLP